jgi:hypothetical protein
MPAYFSAQLSAISRLALAAATLPLMTACGSNQGFAPTCPKPVILRDGADLQRFRGPGHDFLDTTLQGRITGLSGSCKQDGPRAVAATVSVGMELTRGPAASGRSTTVGYFVAVSRGNRILDKRVYTLHAVFPENTDRLRLSGDRVDLELPVNRGQGADSYQLTVGFQLTPQELAWNRQRRTQP